MSQNKIMLTDEQMANFTSKGYLVPMNDLIKV